MTERYDVVVIGAGFAGSIAARALKARGRRVLLVERSRHPRFALGESSTPLAALSLERLAARYGLPDLAALAAYGRWMEELPHLRRGLKRGFTFYGHTAGETYRTGTANGNRLLVAASPADAVADSHWLREDVDAHLVERAVAEGVVYRDGVVIGRAESDDRGVRLEGEAGGDRIEADFAIDASGPAGVLAGRSGDASSVGEGLNLVYGHFEGVRPFAEIAAAEGTALASGPYADDLAAVHHVTAEGWMYVLRFDHGVTSAGFSSTDPEWFEGADPEAVWQRVLARYPSVARQFEAARPVRPVAIARQLRYRRRAAVGRRWLALPASYAFTDALFSTGIAWSLLGVERAVRLFDEAVGPGPGEAALARYAELLGAESDHIERLVGAAYSVFGTFERLVPLTWIYFAAASWAESLARLDPERCEWCWEGFLGARDPVILEALDGFVRHTGDPAHELARRTAEAIEPRDVAGLTLSDHRNLIPADLETLVTGASKLGLSPDAVRAALPRLLRGEALTV